MPELAAHLERVAKRERLAQQWAQSWLDTQSKAPGINLGEMEQSLAGMLLRWGAQYAKDESAAALAACAREARLDEAKWWEPYIPDWFLTAAEQKLMVERLAALERAAGEKAPLDPQRGQHEG